ncbi:MAG: hypothetical protein LBK60_10400 [Verrucomicrobiales bacterium]|jgi:hypothetical protein|nr:hypothetical protein [Verrucomicrobiales bacterium]
MGSWVLNLGQCLLLLAAAFACLQSWRAWVRRLGIWLVFAALGLGAWFVSGSWWLVAACLSCWFLLPLAQTVWLSRTLRFAKNPALTAGALEEEDLAEMQPLTVELQDLDFILDRDYWLEPSPTRHGLRLFQHRAKPVYAAIGLLKQGRVSLFYLQFATADADGGAWITWDFPLPDNLKIPPRMNVYRCLEARDAAELLAQHEAFLQINEVRSVAPEQRPDASLFFTHLGAAVIDYNLSAGVLRANPDADGDIGYSWRGTWYVARKVLRALVAD